MSPPLVIRFLASKGLARRTLGRIAFAPAPMHERADTFLAMPMDEPDPGADALRGHAAVLLEQGRQRGSEWPTDLPSVEGFANMRALSADDVVVADPRSCAVQILFRPDSPHNALFITNRCNSRCLMCPQPPTKADDGWLLDENQRLLALIRHAPEALGITGGGANTLGRWAAASS